MSNIPKRPLFVTSYVSFLARLAAVLTPSMKLPLPIFWWGHSAQQVISGASQSSSPAGLFIPSVVASEVLLLLIVWEK